MTATEHDRATLPKWAQARIFELREHIGTLSLRAARAEKRADRLEALERAIQDVIREVQP